MIVGISIYWVRRRDGHSMQIVRGFLVIVG